MYSEYIYLGLFKGCQVSELDVKGNLSMSWHALSGRLRGSCEQINAGLASYNTGVLPKFYLQPGHLGGFPRLPFIISQMISCCFRAAPGRLIVSYFCQVGGKGIFISF